MPVRGRLHRGLGRRGLVALLAVAGALGAPGAAQAAVTFDRAFGTASPRGRDTGGFEKCTSRCQTGTQSGAAGGLEQPGGVAVDAQGRILVGANQRLPGRSVRGRR